MKYKNSQYAVPIAVLLVTMAITLYFRFQQTAPSSEQPVNNHAQESISPETGEAQSEVQNQIRAALEKEYGSEPGAKLLKNEMTRLFPVAGGASTAIATRDYDGHNFIHTIVADLGDPDPGQSYYGWMTRDNSDSDYYLSGKFEKKGAGFELIFTGFEDMGEYKHIIVSTEIENGYDPEIPSQVILAGVFDE